MPLVCSGRGGWQQWLGTEPLFHDLWAKDGGGEQGRASARDQTVRCEICLPHSVYPHPNSMPPH